MKKFLIYLTVFLFVSCGSPQIPKWYVNTPKDTTLYFYSSAEGYTKENALKNALNDIASRINVKISSSFVINKGIHNQKTYSEIYQQINTQIKNIDFNNYEIIKLKKEDGKYYVLLRVNKQKLISNLKHKINMQIGSVNFSADSPIKKVIKAYHALKTIKKIKSRIFILESLGEPIDGYINQIQKIENKARKIILNTKFKISANIYKTPSAEVLSKYLNIDKHSKNEIKIIISVKKLKLFNYYLIKGKATVFLNAPYTITFLGKSASSFKEAEFFAKEEYKKRLLDLLKQIF